ACHRTRRRCSPLGRPPETPTGVRPEPHVDATGCRRRLPGLLFEHTFESREDGMVSPPGLPVQYGRGKATTVGYLATAGDPTGGVVVAHDRYGALPHLRARCELLARSGMTALAPDLYGGRFTIDEAEAEHLAVQLDPDLAVTRLVGAVEYLRRRGVERLGLLGFSLGGCLGLPRTTPGPGGGPASHSAGLPAGAW